jgi:hypothetical protein
MNRKSNLQDSENVHSFKSKLRIMKSLFLFCATLLSALVCLNCKTPVPQSGDWVFIADKVVDYGIDRDVIRFSNVRDDFRQIKFLVTSAPLRILDMKIHFDNGTVQDVKLRSVIPQGGASRVIDLPGGTRHLEKIEFWYKPAARGSKDRSRVAVWGKT